MKRETKGTGNIKDESRREKKQVYVIQGRNERQEAQRTRNKLTG